MTSFSPRDYARYRRQIALDGFGADGQTALRDAHVAVIGAGGLGSPALLYLAGTGVGHVTVIDDDVVELSNLHRQIIHTDATVGEAKADSARREMLARNPGMTVTVRRDKLDAATAAPLLQGADVVLDGTDNFAARYAASHGCAVLGVPHVWGSILGFDAQLGVFGLPGGPVYEDVFPTAPPAGSVPSCAEAGVLGPVVGVVGAAMAMEAVKIIAGVGEPLSGELGYYSGLTGHWEYIPVTADPAVAQRVRETPTAVHTVPPGPTASTADVPSLDGVTLLDVREPDEFATVHIPGAVNVPLSILQQGVPESVTASDGRETVVYCASGSRSARAVGLLASAGVPARNYPGGINAWLETQ